MYIDDSNRVTSQTDFEEKVVQRLSDISLTLAGMEDTMKIVADALESMAPKVPSWCQVPDD